MARATKGLSAERLRELARSSAESLLTRLRAEVAAIERTFPELSGAARGRTVKKARKRARAMSAAARKAVSARMKKYWAERRKAEKKNP